MKPSLLENMEDTLEIALRLALGNLPDDARASLQYDLTQSLEKVSSADLHAGYWKELSRQFIKKSSMARMYTSMINNADQMPSEWLEEVLESRKPRQNCEDSDYVEFIAGRVSDIPEDERPQGLNQLTITLLAPSGLNQAMANLWGACQKNDQWMLALSAVSQGFSDYDQYANFMTHWPEYTLLPEQELILIDEMYKVACDA